MMFSEVVSYDFLLHGPLYEYFLYLANWELKKTHDPFISKHNTHDLHDLYFPKGVLNTNEHSKCEGQKQF